MANVQLFSKLKRIDNDKRKIAKDTEELKKRIKQILKFDTRTVEKVRNFNNIDHNDIYQFTTELNKYFLHYFRAQSQLIFDSIY